MYKPFFGIQYKVTLLVLVLVCLFTFMPVNSQAQLAELEDRVLLADLIEGGAELFSEVSEGVIQILSLDLSGMGSAGSGYIIDKEGYAITNRHVTDGKKFFEITFYGEEEKSRNLDYRHKGVLIAEDPALDMALIKVDAPYEKFHPVKLGVSGDMKLGDIVATCGSPGGESGNVNPSNFAEGWLEFFNINLGVLNEIVPFETFFAWGFTQYDVQWDPQRREHYGTACEYVFHVDAAINHGNSGGPCFNAYGEAIGTNTWGLGGENYGLSVPTDFLKKSAADIIAYGQVRRPWVGIALNDERVIQSARAGQMIEGTSSWGLWFDPRPDEMEIKIVNPYSPAYEAGLREGDIIELINDEKIEYIFDIYSMFLNARIGDEIEFKIRRGKGSPFNIIVEVGVKKVRYHGAQIYGGGLPVMGQLYDIGNISIQSYYSPVTY